ALPDDRHLITALLEMPVDAVVADIQSSILVPLDGDVVWIEGGILDPGVGLDPIEALAHFTPEPIGVGDRALVHLLVLYRIDPRPARPLWRNGIDFLRHRETSQDA